MPTATQAAPSEEAPDPVGGPYARYVLGLLVVVYVFNFIDRQIVSILAERIKADLGLSDDDIGFLYGTAFAVFYAIFGIPLGVLADVWARARLISIGLAFWSLMTTVSGLAQSFAQLAAARIGVGVGEASATPAAYSLLSDTFPAARRATAIAIYSSGIYIGAGLGLGIGGVIVDTWDSAYAGGAAPFSLRGWQVAYLAVGLPGLLLALWVSTLREPVRGQADGIFSPPEPHPLRVFARELLAVTPPFTAVNLFDAGRDRDGLSPLAINQLAAIAIAAVAALLVAWTGNTAQWVALGIGLYAAVSWGQALALRDRPTHRLIFGTPSLRYIGFGFSFLAFVGYGVGFWTPPYAVRILGVGEAEAGTILGGTAAAGGFLGVTLGGLLADAFRRRSPRGRLFVGVLNALAPPLVALVMFTTESRPLFYALSFVFSILSSLWIAPGASTVQDLVLPRMRATTSAAYLLVITFIGLALGPYTIGSVSEELGDLRVAILLGMLANAAALVLILLAMRHLERDETSVRARARAAGEAEA